MSKDKVLRTLEKAQNWEFEIWSEENEDHVEIYLDDVVNVIDSIKYLENENKRYRELITTIATDDSMTYRQIVDLSIEALEGDPHESS